MFNDDKRTVISIVSRFVIHTLSRLHYHLIFKKKFSHISARPQVIRPWGAVVYGPDISMGSDVVMFNGRGEKTTLSSMETSKGRGRITIGNNVLIMSGVRISSACGIEIGDGCMLANRCYITDADWHDLHNRTDCPGECAPIILKRGAWIGDSAIICKGVTIGEHSVVGAGSVVTRDVPDNVVVAGNPAKVVRRLDPGRVVLMGDDSPENMVKKMFGDAPQTPRRGAYKKNNNS